MNTLLIIDPQNDFCNQGNSATGEKQGALYVKNAELDMQRLSKWIISNSEKIDELIVTLDNHQPNDIAHPNFWKNQIGEAPAPFTQILAEDVKRKKWIPLFEAEKVEKYLEALEAQKEFSHIIWPPHCLIGSVGAAIYQPVLDAMRNWTKQGKFYQVVHKGSYPFSEHFGAFAAQVISDEIPETQVNYKLIKQLKNSNTIFIAGEARSHCVANTLKQLMQYAPEIIDKLIILEDTMSNVTGFENIADDIFNELSDKKAKFRTTEKML